MYPEYINNSQHSTIRRKQITQFKNEQRLEQTIEGNVKSSHAIPLHVYENGFKNIIPSADEDKEQVDLSYIAVGNLKQYSHSGTQVGSFFFFFF